MKNTIINSKKDLGAFYTPLHTVDYMINLLSNIDKNGKLLEPCGGDGIFVKRIIDKKIIDPEDIEVWDINPNVRQNFDMYNVHFKVKDTLLDTEVNNLFNSEYQYIIGNPPYLNKQSSYIKKNKYNLKKIYKNIGVNDTYALFIYLCSNLLSENGELVFIVSDTYRTLKIHKKLRQWLLKNFTIKEITICPNKLFKEKGIIVNTSIIHIINKKPAENHNILFNDCRKNELGNYDGKVYNVNQFKILNYPDSVMYFKNNQKIFDILDNSEKLINYLDGGLGMHTTNNGAYLARIKYEKNNLLSKKHGKINKYISIKEIDNKNWRIYHKTGGNNSYYKKPGYVIKWDKNSQKKYKGYKNIKHFKNRHGFIVSGVCSSLSARLAIKGAMWESNKAMCFFPKNPKKYPSEFFIGILNSNIYKKIIKIFNHTNSIQIRDVKKLPFFNFSEKDIKNITKIVKNIINQKRKNQNYDYSPSQYIIDKIVKSYAYEKSTNKIKQSTS